MKLNCPICGEMIDDTHYGTDLGMHLYWNHKSKDPEKDAGDVFRYYACVVYSIHKKIEDYEKGKQDHFELPTTVFAIESIVIGELKSLLENKDATNT